MYRLLREALSNPKQIPGYIRNNGVDRVRGMIYKRRRDLPEQKELIHEFIRNDEFGLVVLDACRYDMFSRHFDRFLSGELEQAWSSASWTGAYVEKTWTEQYDMTYLGAATHVSDHSFESRNREYRPSEHITRIIQLWNTDWNPAYGTVHPEKVTDAALAEATRDSPTRMVVHYMQPHSPYIGETKILPWGIDERNHSEQIEQLAREVAERADASDKDPEKAVESLDPSEIDFDTVVEYDLGPRQFQQWEEARPTDSIISRIESGDITDQELRLAYRDNLLLVFREVVRLVSRLNCDVVVTADHGEFLGESGRYFHPPTGHPIVRAVPWLRVSDECIGTEPIADRYHEMDLQDMVGTDQVDEDVFEHRLKALGYVEDT